jgi:RNA polymerase sigma factor (sigma-70 family)
MHSFPLARFVGLFQELPAVPPCPPLEARLLELVEAHGHRIEEVLSVLSEEELVHLMRAGWFARRARDALWLVPRPVPPGGAVSLSALVVGFFLNRAGRHNLELVLELRNALFVRICASFHLYDPAKGPFRPWVFQAARWSLADWFDRRQQSPLPPGEHPALIDPRSSPVADVLRHERQAVVRQAVAQLPPAERQTIELHLEGLGRQEISGQLHKPLHCVDRLLNRARNHLRELIPPSIRMGP